MADNHPAPLRSALAGFLIAPAVPVAYSFFISGMATHAGPKGLFWMLLLEYLIAGGLEVVLVLPAFLLLYAVGLVSWWSTALAGTLLGFAVARLFSGYSNDFDAVVAIGTASGLAFWAVWKLGAYLAGGSGEPRPAEQKPDWP